MLGAVTNITTVLGSAPPADADSTSLKSFARAAASIGLHLLLIEPGGKKPVDVRSANQRRIDDGVAKDAARAAGQPNWDKARSKGGVHLATADPTLLARYIDRYRHKDHFGEGAPINFGVAVGPSKLIVVDCDTKAQLDAFLRDFGADPNTPPTVRSPGQRDAQGHWAHSDGGHFYFTVDETLPGYPGSITTPGEYAILWADRYVLIPPSVRPEGPYRLIGQDFPAPATITGLISRTVQAKIDKHIQAASPDVATAVDTWALSVSWDDILAPAGWTLAARPDNCGCDIWTAPGDHASPKSATAHDTECSLGRYTTQNAPLHIWTDNPGTELEAWCAASGTKTVSRLQAVAALQYGGKVGDAMRDLEVMPNDSAALGFGRDLARDLGIASANLDERLDLSPPPTPSKAEADADPFVLAGSVALPTDGGSEAPAPDPDEEMPVAGVPHIMPFSHWREFPAPEFAIDGLLEHRGFTAVIGAPGIGKSGVVLDMAASIALGKRWMGRETLRQNVLYLPGEGLSGAVQRLLAWEAAHDLDVGGDLYVADSIIQVMASADAWRAVVEKILEHRVGMVIIDTFARASVGLEENSATDVGKAIARFDDVRKATGSGLMVVHHTNKSGASGRGSSALNGALDTEIMIEEGAWWDSDDPCPGRQLQAIVTKQKNAAAPEGGIPMLATSYGSSFIMTGPSGLVDDPMDQVYSPRALIPETVVSIAIRLQDFATRFRGQGITRSELAYGVPPDDYTNQRRDAKTAWKLRVAEAVDLAIQYGLLETFTGQATGARYIDGPLSADKARERWAKEQISD